MGSPNDIVVGRLAQERGWVDPAALRSVYANLPPGLSLLEALAQRGLLSPAHVQALSQELGLGPSNPTVQLPPPSNPTAYFPPPATATAHFPPPSQAGTAHWSPAPQDGSQTLPLSPPGQSGTAHWSPQAQAGGATLPPPGAGGAVGQDGTATLPPQGPGLASGSGSGLDAPTLVGGAPANLSGSRVGGLPQPGDVMVGRYEIVRVLGQGGMGAVYLAGDRQRGVQVALKVMLPGAAGEGALIRFQREAEALAKVDDHIGIVRIRDYGSEGGLPYAALDLIEGGDLHERVKSEGALPVDEAVRLTAEVARAIHHCHERSILHRDLKPANVMVRTADGAPFVTDFGLAYDSEDSTERLTQTGQVMGTPAYMPPEQAEGDKEQIDARSDVYGLGAILYELLAGEAPFKGEGMAIIKKVLLDEPQDLHERRPEVSPDLARIQQKAMAKDPDLRYASAGAFAADLERLQRGEPIEARPPTRAERQRWRRRQGDKRAIASYVGLRFLLPIGLVLGLALGVFQIKPGQRYQIRRALQDHVPSVLQGPIAYPGSPGAAEVQREATLLLTNLSAVHGIELSNPERPDLALRSLLANKSFEDADLRQVLEDYAPRVDVALGARPAIPSARDPEAPTLQLLRDLAFGTDLEPVEPSSLPKTAPPGAPQSSSDLLKALQRARRDLRTFEEGGWTKAKKSKQDAWEASELGGDLERRLGRYGGLRSWETFVAHQHRKIKREAVLSALAEVRQGLASDRFDPYLAANVCTQGRRRLAARPKDDPRALDEALLELVLISLGEMRITSPLNNEIEKHLGRSKLRVDFVTEIDDLVDWDQLRARLAERPDGGSLENLIAPYLKGGEVVPSEVLVLVLRLGLRLKGVLDLDPNRYADELKKHIELRRKSGRASGAAYLLHGDALNLRARRTEVDRDNPEIIVQTVSAYASALGRANLPFDPTLYEHLVVEEPSAPPPERWARYCESRAFTLLSEHDHYVRTNRPHDAPRLLPKHQKMLRFGLDWFAARGAGVPLSERVNVVTAIARRSREIQASYSPEEFLGIEAEVIRCLDQVIEDLLLLSRQLGGKEERKETLAKDLDRGVGPDHLQRNLAGLLDAYCGSLRLKDFDRCLKRVREVHALHHQNMGSYSHYLYKTASQLCLSTNNYDEALVEVTAFLTYLKARGRDLDDLPGRIDAVEAWLAQIYAVTKDLPRARSIYAAAVKKGGGKHHHWNPVLPLLKE